MITISRPMMMNAIHADARPTETRAMSTPDTSSLSAVVSRNVPSVVVCFHRRANRPSKKSVAAAIANRMAATTYAYCTRYPTSTNAITTGVSATRRYVMPVRKAAARSSGVLTTSQAS